MKTNRAAMELPKKLSLTHFRSYSITGIGVASAQAISLLALPYIAKLSGPDSFGLYNYYFSIVVVLAVFCTFKLENAVFVVSDAKLVLLRQTFDRVLVVSCCVVTGISGWLFFDSSTLQLMSFAIGFCIFCMAKFEYFIQENIRLGHFKANAIARFFRAVLFPVCFFLISIFNEPSASAIILSYALANLMVLFIPSDSSYTLSLLGTLPGDRKSIWMDVKTTALFLTSAHFFNRYSSVAFFLLIVQVNPEYAHELAMFALAYKFTISPAHIVISAISDVFKKQLLDNPVEALRQFLKMSVFTVLIAFVVSVGLYLFSEKFVAMVMGEEWSTIANYSKALIPYLVATLVLSPITYTYLIYKKQKWDFIWQILNSIAITVSILLGAQYSVEHAAYAYSISAALSLLVSSVICYRLIKTNGKLP